MEDRKYADYELHIQSALDFSRKYADYELHTYPALEKYPLCTVQTLRHVPYYILVFSFNEWYLFYVYHFLIKEQW